jgi:hypothetical protein
MSDPIRLTSSEWEIALDVLVVDPDGWDRMDLAESWAEHITEDEFKRRLMESTIVSPRNGWVCDV